MAIDDVLLETEEKMEHAIEYLKSEFRGIRTGRASAGLVDHVKIEYYGSQTDLRQLANISTPDASLIVIKPFDPSSLKDIERAIQAANIGITPHSDGKVIRLAVPPLSGERRQQIVGQLKKMGEASRVAIRNIRRDANKSVEKLQKDGDATEDDLKIAKDDVQELTDKFQKQVDAELDSKIKEVEAI